MARTEPALNLDALIGGFRPVFRALAPEKVNTIASAIITVFQGQGGTINDILDQTAQLTSALADRDEAIGAVVKNLSTVLDSIVAKAGEVDATVVNLETLITGLSDRPIRSPTASASLSNADRCAGAICSATTGRCCNRPSASAQGVLRPIVDQSTQLDDLLHKLPTALTLLGRSAGTYGDFINLYLCDVTLTLNGLTTRWAGPYRPADAAADRKVHAAMRALEPENRVRIGIDGRRPGAARHRRRPDLHRVPMLFAQPRYYGEFTDAGALRAGDKVRIAGMDVGAVQELKLATGHVVVRFTVGDNVIGHQEPVVHPHRHDPGPEGARGRTTR